MAEKKKVSTEAKLIFQTIFATIFTILLVMVIRMFLQVFYFLLNVPSEDFTIKLCFMGICVFIIALIFCLHFIPDIIESVWNSVIKTYKELK